MDSNIDKNKKAYNKAFIEPNQSRNEYKLFDDIIVTK